MGVGVARLLAGEPAAHGVGGLYAVTARGDDLTIAAVNRGPRGRRPPALLVEQHGSLHLGAVAQVVGRFGFAMLVGRSAMTRLSPRHYGAAGDSFG